MPARDYQKAKVYLWERAQGFIRSALVPTSIKGLDAEDKAWLMPNELSVPPLSLDACQVFVCRIWETYGLDPTQAPAVKSGNHNAAAWANRWQISLPPWARTKEAICHESAHSLTDNPGLVPHGPVFVRVYLDLLGRFCGVDVRTARLVAERGGIDVATREYAKQYMEERCRSTLKQTIRLING